MQLPTQIKKASVTEPKVLLLFAQPKTGKTSNLSKLPNSLIIDLEDGADYYDCMSINVKQEALNDKVSPLRMLMSIPEMIKKANEEAGKKVYDFIILDTTSALEDLALILALFRYRQSPMGKSFSEDSILKLPQGSGYLHLRNGFEELYNSFKGLAGKCLILSGHVKTATITKKGVDLNARDINLTGKLKLIVSSDCDAIGYMYRDSKEGNNKLSFLTEETDLATGSRQDYLSGKEFEISKVVNGKLETYWEQIFPSIKQ